MPKLKRWAPVIGSAVLVAVVVLRMIGQTELAGALEGVAGAIGITTQAPVSGVEVAAAAAAVVGIVLKVAAEVRKALDEPRLVR